AGIGIYWGPNNPGNSSGRVPGPNTRERAELFAILMAVQRAAPDRTLHIRSQSRTAIDCLTWNAHRLDSRGWDCLNGDILRRIVHLIRQRPAAVHFRLISRENAPRGMTEAHRLAQ
ncbi:hypothetical protein AURDEDRAFT_34824, partial [Auricularia subglabra TFB-10046 SS5]